MVLATSFGGKFATSVVKLFEEYSVIPLSSITALTRQSLSSYETSPISSASLPLQLHTHVAQLLCSSGEWQRALAIVHALNKKEQTELIEQATREDWPLPSSTRWSITSPSLVIDTNNYENRECTKNVLNSQSDEKLLCEEGEIIKRKLTEHLTNTMKSNEENKMEVHNRKLEEHASVKWGVVINNTNNNGVESNEHSTIESNSKTELASQIISMPLEEIVNHAFHLDWPLANDFAGWPTLKKEQVAIFDELVKRHAWRELVQCAIHWERKRSRAEHALQSHAQREKYFTEQQQHNREVETTSGAIDFFRPVNAIQQMMFTLHSTPFHANASSVLLNDVNASRWKASHATSEKQTVSSSPSPSSFLVAEYTLTFDEQTALQNTVLEHYTLFFVECVTVNWVRSEYYFANTPQSKSFAKRAAITLLKYISSSECMLSANNRHISTLSTNLLHTAPFMSSFTKTMEEHSRLSNRWSKENKSNASLENAWSVLAFVMRQIHRELQVENFAHKRELLELIIHTLQTSTHIHKNTSTLKSSTSPQYYDKDDVLQQLSWKTCDDMCGVMETICSVLIRNEREVQSLTLSVFAQLVEVLSVIQCNPPNALVQCLFLTIGDGPISTLHDKNSKLEERLGRDESTERMFTENVEFVSYDKRRNNCTDDALHSFTLLMADKQVSDTINKEQITDVDMRSNQRDVKKSNDVLHTAIQFIISAPLSRWRVALHLLTCAKQQNVFAVTSAHLHALLSGLNGLSIAMTWSQALSCAEYCNTHFQLIPDELTCRRMVSNLEHASWERAFEVLRWYNTKQEKYSNSILRDLHRIAMKHANWRVTLEIMEKLIRDCGTSLSFVHYLYTIHALATAGEVETCWKYFIMMKQNTINGEDRSPFNVITISIPFVALLENEHYTEAQEFARLICNEVHVTKTNRHFNADSRDNDHNVKKKTQWECQYKYGTKANSVFSPYELTRSGLVLTLAVQLLCWLHLHDDKHILELFNKLNDSSNEVEECEEKQEFMRNQWATETETKFLANAEAHRESKSESNERKNAGRKGNMYAITLTEVLWDTVLVQSMCGLAYLRAPVRLAYSLLEDRELTNHNDERVQESDMELAPSSEFTSANEESRHKRKKMYISHEHRRRRSAILAELLGHFVQRHERDMSEEFAHTIASTMANHNVGVQYLQACVM